MIRRTVHCCPPFPPHTRTVQSRHLIVASQLAAMDHGNCPPTPTPRNGTTDELMQMAWWLCECLIVNVRLVVVVVVGDAVELKEGTIVHPINRRSMIGLCYAWLSLLQFDLGYW